MAEVIVDLPDNLDGVDVDQSLLQEALAALSAKKRSQAKSRERRENMTEEEKIAAAERSKRRRAVIALQVNFAKKSGYEPSDDEVDAFLAAQE